MTATILVDNNPREPIVEPVGGGLAGDDIATQRRAMFAKFDRTETEIDLEKVVEDKLKAAEPPREDFDSVEIQTPIGVIDFGPPTGVSLTLRIAIMKGEDNANRMESAMLRTLMSIRSIDGKHVKPIGSLVEAQALANIVGDGLLDHLYLMMLENFPPPRKADLQILRKNKRGT